MKEAVHHLGGFYLFSDGTRKQKVPQHTSFQRRTIRCQPRLWSVCADGDDGGDDEENNDDEQWNDDGDDDGADNDKENYMVVIMIMMMMVVIVMVVMIIMIKMFFLVMKMWWWRKLWWWWWLWSWWLWSWWWCVEEVDDNSDDGDDSDADDSYGDDGGDSDREDDEEGVMMKRTLYLEHIPVLFCCMTNDITAPSHTSMGPISRPSIQARLHVVLLMLAPKNRYVRMGTNTHTHTVCEYKWQPMETTNTGKGDTDIGSRWHAMKKVR